MACELTKGKALPCRDAQGGIKAAYFIDYDANLRDEVTTDADGTITGFPVGTTAYKYVLPRGTSGFDQAIISSLEMGTTFYEGTMTAIINGMSQVDINELELLAQGNPHAVLETQNGDFVLAAISNGLVASGTAGYGIALGDRVGASLTLISQEPHMAPYVTGFLTDPNVAIVEETL